MSDGKINCIDNWCLDATQHINEYLRHLSPGLTLNILMEPKNKSNSDHFLYEFSVFLFESTNSSNSALYENLYLRHNIQAALVSLIGRFLLDKTKFHLTDYEIGELEYQHSNSDSYRKNITKVFIALMILVSSSYFLGLWFLIFSN